MEINIQHYELNPILTMGEVFDLVFSESKNLTFSTIEEATSYDDILAGFYDLMRRNIWAGVPRVIGTPWGLRFNRDEIFGWFVTEGILKYYEDQGIIIPKEVYALVEKYAAPAENKPEQATQEDELTFCLVGKTWRVGFADFKNIPNTKGMAYLQYFLFNPNKRFTGLEIHGLGKMDSGDIKSPKVSNDPNALKDEDKWFDPTPKEDDSNSVEMADGKTLSLKKDLEEAYNVLLKAEEENDPAVDLLRKEYEDALKYYQSLHDLHGKSRDPSALENKAVKAVAKNLKTAEDNILEYLPELADLMKDIKTGNTYGYFPSQPDKPVKISTKKQK